MRRAAALAIALVVAILLLAEPSGPGARGERRGGAATPGEVPAPAAREAPEPRRHLPAREDPATLADGVVTDADGRPVAGFRLMALPRDGDGEHSTPTDANGAFVFRDLPRGEYRLAIEGDWMFEEDITFREGTKGVRAVATRTKTVEVLVLDLATSEPIPRFTVRHADGRTTEGRDGVFRAQAGSGIVGLEAEGYHGRPVLHLGGDPASRRFWLARAVEPRLALRVRFEDGAPCEEEATVLATHLGEPRTAVLPAAHEGGGLYRVPLPPGSWDLEFRPAFAYVFHRPCTGTAELAAGERREILLELERGGEIVVRRRGFDGQGWPLHVSGGRDRAMMRGVVTIGVEADEYVMRHVMPGWYVFRASVDAAGTREWSQAVEVTAGSRHELMAE